MTQVLDASHLTKERTTNSEVKIFKLNDVLENDSVFLGFGKPNVYLGYPSTSDDSLNVSNGFFKFDAKSFKRSDSKNC